MPNAFQEGKVATYMEVPAAWGFAEAQLPAASLIAEAEAPAASVRGSKGTGDRPHDKRSFSVLYRYCKAAFLEHAWCFVITKEPNYPLYTHRLR